jgi:enoyl-CoA hydratase/carnithine racemase
VEGGEPVSVERERLEDGIEVIRINRPEARNAIDGPTAKALAEAFDAAEADPGVRAVILTGAGDKAFSAGMDLKAFASGQMADVINAKGGFAGIARRHFPKPLIAAVNGHALAGGCEIALSCDLIVAAEHATFGVPEVKRGLMAAAGALLRLPRRLPLSVALELILTGDAITAQRAYELGLVNKVVPSEELMTEAVALAKRIVVNAPLALRYSKEVAYRALGLPEEEGWKINDEAMPKVFFSKDAIEGAVAFAEKRPPRWSGE